MDVINIHDAVQTLVSHLQDSIFYFSGFVFVAQSRL